MAPNGLGPFNRDSREGLGVVNGVENCGISLGATKWPQMPCGPKGVKRVALAQVAKLISPVVKSQIEHIIFFAGFALAWMMS